MSANEWYYAKGDQQKGPVSSAELKQLAASEEISPDDLVWREGMGEWVAASNVRGLFEGRPKAAKDTPAAPAKEAPAAPESPAFQSAPEPPTVHAATPTERVHGRRGDHVFDILLDALRAQFTARFIDSTTRLFVTCGNIGLLAVMGMSLVFSLVSAIKSNAFNQLIPGLIFFLVLAVLQYVANRCSTALERLNRTTGGHIQSQTFPDCFALINVIAGIGILLFMTIAAIQTEIYTGVLLGLVVFVICQYLAFISLNLCCLNIQVEEKADAGEESIGVLSFLLKAVIRLVPVAYGAGVVYAAVLFFYAFYLRLIADDALGAADSAFSGMLWGGGAGLLPFLGYLLFLSYYLWVAVVRAILAIPGKLDSLAADKEGNES